MCVFCLYAQGLVWGLKGLRVALSLTELTGFTGWAGPL